MSDGARAVVPPSGGAPTAATPPGPPPPRSQEQRRTRLEALRDRFLAVSLRSRTLRLTRTSKSGALDLTRLPATMLPRVVQQLGTTGASEQATALADVIGAAAATKAAGAVLSEDIATLAHAARAVLMETGAGGPAVGFPFPRGAAAGGPGGRHARPHRRRGRRRLRTATGRSAGRPPYGAAPAPRRARRLRHTCRP